MGIDIYPLTPEAHKEISELEKKKKNIYMACVILMNRHDKIEIDYHCIVKKLEQGISEKDIMNMSVEELYE